MNAHLVLWRRETTSDDKLLFKNHCLDARRKFIEAWASLYPLINRKSGPNLRHKMTLIRTTILPILTNVIVAWGHPSKTTTLQPQRHENISLRFAFDAP